MRKLFILCAFLLQFLSPVYSQQATTATIEPNLKYGKPSKEELSLSPTDYRALGTHQNPETTRSVIRRRVRSTNRDEGRKEPAT